MARVFVERGEACMSVQKVEAPDSYVLMIHTVIAPLNERTSFSMKFFSECIVPNILSVFEAVGKVGPAIIGLIPNGSSVKASS